MKPFLMVIAASLSVAAHAHGDQPLQSSSADPLVQTIAQLDTAVFAAFNRCTDPVQLEAHANFFTENVEFYHDNGGVTWNRADMLANTKNHVCGRFTRELVAGSLAVYPIKDFGAIELGSHRFCQIDSGNCEGLADFTIVWQHTEAGWKITRVLSFGHRASAGGS